MKKTFRLLALVIMLVMSGQAIAQMNGTMFLSAAFPVGNYGKGENNAWSLTANNLDSRYAGASIGANVGLKWNFGIGVPGLSVMLSADGFFNGLNNDLKEYFDEREIDMKNNQLIKSYTLNRPRYINVPVMVGLHQIFYLTSSFGIYIEAGLGGNARFITNYEETVVDALNISTSTIYDYKTAFSFAYQVGTGFEVSKNFVIGASFYDLGASKVVAERTRPILGTDTYKNEKGVRPMMMLVRIGFKF